MHESAPFRLRESKWAPPPGVTDHEGNPLPPDREFAAAPPAEIGPVLTAWSTVSSAKAVWPTWLRLVRCLSVGGAVIAAAELFAWWQWRGDAGEEPRNIVRGIALTVGPVVTLLTAWGTRWLERCTYVGRDGAAEFTHTGGPVRGKLLRFADVANLKAHLVDVYYNGFYSGSRVGYTWLDAAGKTMLRVRGAYYRSSKPQPQSRHVYAHAIERAWTEHVLGRCLAEIERTGSAKFVVDRRRTIAVGEGFVEITKGSKTDRIGRNRLKSAGVEEGTFKVRTTEADDRPQGQIRLRLRHRPQRARAAAAHPAPRPDPRPGGRPPRGVNPGKGGYPPMNTDHHR